MDEQDRVLRLTDALKRCGPITGPGAKGEGCPLGVAAIDDLLPEGGLPKGVVTEVLSPRTGVGTGTLTLLLPMMARLTEEGRKVAIIDQEAEVNPAGLASCGVNLAEVILCRPKNLQDALWATGLCVQDKNIALTVATFDRIRDLSLRRLQLVSGKGEDCCVLIRPADTEGSSPLRIRVTPLPLPVRTIRVDILRCRGKLPPPPIYLEVEDNEKALGLHMHSALPLPAANTTKTRASA